MNNRIKRIAPLFLAAAIGMPFLCGVGSFCAVRAEDSSEEPEEYWFKDMYNTTFGSRVIAPAKSPANEDAAWLGTYAWYGKYDGNPVKYRVLYPGESNYGGSSGSVLMDCDSVLFTGVFNYDGQEAKWARSTLREALNGDAFLNKEGVFTDVERNAILSSSREQHDLVIGTGKGKVTNFAKTCYDHFVPLTGDKIFLLDAEDCYNPFYGYSQSDNPSVNRIKKDKNGYTADWWMRSEAEQGTRVGEITDDGMTDWRKVSSSSGIAPAMNLDRSKVLFTSIVEGINEDTGYGAEVKFTLKDPDISISLTHTDGYYNASGVVHVPYKVTGAHASSVNQVSIVITKESTITDQTPILYYTSLESQYGFFTEGEGVFLKPYDAVTGKWGKDYHVFLVAESIHEQHESDYASALVEIPEPGLGVPVSQTVFTDANFLAYVKQFDTDNNGFFSPGELAAVKKIDCSNMEISSLSGIVNFFCLEDLRCMNNSLPVLDVAMITSLKRIYCANNQIEVMYLDDCDDLVILSCGHNHLDKIDLSGKKKLRALYCMDNELPSLHLIDCQSIETVDCRLNYIPSAPPVPADLCKPTFSPQKPDVEKVTATVENDITVQLSWKATGTASAYEVWEQSSPDSDYVLIADNVTTTTYTRTVDKSGTYSYQVLGKVKVEGETYFGRCGYVENVKLGLETPANVKAVSESATSVKVSWNAVAGATGYQVWRSTSPDKSFVSIGTVTTTYKTSTALTTGTKYYYKVRAYKEVDGAKIYGNFSSVVNAIPKIAKPSGVKAESESAVSIKVSWNAVADATGYQVWRSTSADSGFVAIGNVTDTARVCAGLTTGKTYYFKVRAYKEVSGTKYYGNYSTVVNSVPKLGVPSGMKAVSASATSIKVSWNAVSGASGYQVWRSTSVDSGFVSVGSVTDTNRVCSGLTTGTTYYFKVRAYKEVSGTKVYGEYSTVVRAVPKLSSPTGVKATVSSSTSVTVSWNKVSGATGYEVWRSEKKDSGYKKIGTVTETSRKCPGLTAGKTYYFKVRAYKEVNGTKVYSAYSTVVSATPK